MTFEEALNMLSNNVSYTENGAQGYKTSRNAYVDFLFCISGLRPQHGVSLDILANSSGIMNLVRNSDGDILRFAMYLRDPRHGIGERIIGRAIVVCLFRHFTWKDKDAAFTAILNNMPEYGRWDDIIEIGYCLRDTKYFDMLCNTLYNQLKEDLYRANEKQNCSLLAKWMPSVNAKQKSREKALAIIRKLGLSEAKYRKILSTLREYLDIVERDASANRWDKINYSNVPSVANLRYGEAFLRHDRERRTEYLEAVKNGLRSINGSVNNPVDILQKYQGCLSTVNPALELLWKNLEPVEGLKDTLVVCDDSGSMWTHLKSASTTALIAARAIAIYCAQHNKAPYKNKVITFSETPRYLDFSSCTSLREINNFLSQHSEVSNTNIEAVFKLILETAITGDVSAANMPKQILIISDMEFDEGVDTPDGALMEQIKYRYHMYGYALPRLVFWNINGRTNTIPLLENENGVYLVSGYSQNILNLLMSGRTQAESLKIALRNYKMPVVDGLREEQYNISIGRNSNY